MAIGHIEFKSILSFLRAFFFTIFFTKQVKGLNHYQVTGPRSYRDINVLSRQVWNSIPFFLPLFLAVCVYAHVLIPVTFSSTQVVAKGDRYYLQGCKDSGCEYTTIGYLDSSQDFQNYSFLLWTHLFFHLHLILVTKEFFLKFMECQYSCTITFLVIFYFTLHSTQTPNPVYICSDSWPLNAPLHCRSCAPYDNLVISIGSCAPHDNSDPIL
jgi:hypothetical protein